MAAEKASGACGPEPGTPVSGKPQRSLRVMALWVGLASQWIGPAMAQPAPQELGASPLRNYHFREYGAHAQNWAIAQDPRGVMYFGNSRGVLEYDGVEWRFVPVSNHSIVRSLAIDDSGTVFVGAVGELGYLRRDAVTTVYVSLVGELAPEERDFTDVWRTFALRDSVFFWTRGRLFCWRGGRFRSFEVGHGFPSQVAGRVLANQRTGLEVFTEDGPRTIEGGEQLADVRDVFVMLRHGDREILAGSRSQGLWLLAFATGFDAGSRLRLARVDRFETGADELLLKHRLYRGVRVPAGGYALATMTGGAVVIDRDGSLRRRIDPSSGLQDPSVWALHVDREGGLWLGLNNGIARAEPTSAWTTFDRTSGLEGTIAGIVRHRGTLYVATSLDLFALDGGRWRGIGGASPPCFSLLSHRPTETGDSRLLLGCHSHVYEVRDDRLVPLHAALNNYALWASTRDPQVVFVGSGNGLGILRFRRGRWIDEGLVDGVEGDIRTIIEDDAGALWLGTYVHGLIRLVLGPDLRVREISRFGVEQGLPDLKGIAAAQISGELVATLRHGGLYQLDEAEGFFRSSGLLGPSFADRELGIYLLVADAGGNFWMRTSTGDREAAALVFRGADGSFPFAAPLRRLPGEVLAILPESDGVTWLGGSDEMLVRFDAEAVEEDSTQPFPTLIRGVFKAGGAPVDGPVLAYADNSLTFHYAAISFDDVAANRYSVRLDGYDPDWSEWTADSKKEYTNLPEADYRFRVRARNVYGTVGDEAAYELVVLPPWYRTTWARLSYLLLAGLFVYGVARLRSLGLERERDRLAEQRTALEAEVEARARAEAEAARALGQRQQLISELEARNAELARFNYTVAHDLRNPLTTIRAFVGRLARHAETGDRDRLRADLLRIDDAALKLQRLLHELYEFSRIDRVSMPCEDVPFGELVREAASELEPKLSERGVELEVAADLPAVCGDRARLLEAVRHVLANAVQYLGDQPAPRIEVGVRRVEVPDAEPPTFFVRDNGMGIDPRYHDKVFELFERLVPGSSEGTGIGLALVKRIVEVHGGRIWVESEGAGRGSTFCFTLAA